MSKSISCGVIITDGVHLVLGHVTNGQFFDIPKGRQDKGENYLQTAVRELREETGLVVDPTALVPLRVYEYKPKKSLMLYVWYVSTMPDAQTLVCKSMFENCKKQKEPELDAFVVATYEHAFTLVNPDLARVLKIVIGEIKK